MPHGFVHVVQPLSPSHHQQCPAVAASGTRRAGRGAGWPLGSDTLGRGRAIRDRGRPAAAVFATSSSRKGDQGDWTKGWSRSQSQSQSQSRSGRSRRCADLERGEAGWTHALREGGGGVRTLHSQPPSVAMIGPDEVHRGLMEVWDVFRVVHAGEVRMGGRPVVHSRSRCRVRPFFFLPSSPSFFPSVRWHGSVWIRGKHTRAPWRPIEGPYEGSLERGGGVGGLYLSANLGRRSSAKKRKAVGRRGHGRGPMREGEGSGKWFVHCGCTHHTCSWIFPVPVSVPVSVPELVPRGWQPEKKLVPCSSCTRQEPIMIDEIDDEQQHADAEAKLFSALTDVFPTSDVSRAVSRLSLSHPRCGK